MTGTMVTASASGSLMICGEHSVVYGQKAIVAAIKQRVQVKIAPLEEEKVIIHSALADYCSPLAALAPEPKLRFVLEALRRHLPEHGIELWIDSEIDPLLGFGSSAAVTVATIAALWALAHKEADKYALHRAAHEVILAVQQRGSGADLAASIWGGMIAYSPAPHIAVQNLPLPNLPLTVRYAGYKTPTAEVLAIIAAAAAKNPAHYAALYQQMGQVSQAAIAAAEWQDWENFYQQLNAYQELMSKLGVCDATQAVHIAAASEIAAASKISGSGLGDCIIAFAAQSPAVHQAVVFDDRGLQVAHGL